MPDDFVSKMIKYLAFLYRELNMWQEVYIRYNSQDPMAKYMVDRLAIQIETARDICKIFGCEAQVWREAMAIYDRKENE